MGVGRIPVFLAAAAVAGATADEARASLFFLLEPTAAQPGDVVTVRTGGTPTPDRVDPDGTLFQKQIWRASGVWGDLVVRFQRLDVPGPALTAQTVSGNDGSWAARLRFPSEGCWKITGRIDDVTLSFVVKVLIRSTG